MSNGMTLATGEVRHAASYRHYALRQSDSDRRGKWSGGDRSAGSGKPVEEAQIDLQVVGCYDGRIDGLFGAAMALAVRRFQWNLSNVDRCITGRPGGRLLARTPAKHVAVTGRIDSNTANELHEWARSGLRTTGTLRVAPLADYRALVRGTLRALQHPAVTRDTMVVHAGFLAALDAIDAAAARAKIKLRINQAFRVAGAPVGGAVVRPATRSQHLIGNAIDWNIENDGKVILAAKTVYSQLPRNVQGFIDEVKNAGLRWGGDWATRDPIHFDAFENPYREDFSMLYFFNQRSIQQQHPLAKAPTTC